MYSLAASFSALEGCDGEQTERPATDCANATSAPATTSALVALPRARNWPKFWLPIQLSARFGLAEETRAGAVAKLVSEKRAVVSRSPQD